MEACMSTLKMEEINDIIKKITKKMLAFFGATIFLFVINIPAKKRGADKMINNNDMSLPN